MSDYTTVQVDSQTRESIRHISDIRGDTNTRQTIRWLVENVEFREKTSHDGTQYTQGIIVERENE